MWIRMLSTAAGPRLPHSMNHGSTYKVEDDLGQELVRVRAAEEVPDPNAPKPAPVVEVAAVDDGETETAEGTEKQAETLIDKLKHRAPPKK